jgi:predicted short-subunit dehydrogenase-like oxidoreductase (DUF2520 family)
MIRSINIIGTGNVASWIAHSCQSHCEILTVFSRKYANAEEFTHKVDAKPIDDLAELDNSADLTFVCVADDAIANIVMNIDSSLTLVHTSGFTEASALEKFDSYGVFYPLQTISKDRVSSLINVPILYEASDLVLSNNLEGLASKLSNSVLHVDSKKRRKIHLAAVFANNFTNHMLSISDEILKESGLKINLFEPLMQETLKKAMEIGPSNSQTGPALRGDQKVQDFHLDQLSKSDWKEVYQLLSHVIREANS